MTIAYLIAVNFVTLGCFHYVWMQVLQVIFFRQLRVTNIQLIWKPCKGQLRKH